MIFREYPRIKVLLSYEVTLVMHSVIFYWRNERPWAPNAQLVQLRKTSCGMTVTRIQK